jgi:hypothetical protein
MQLFVNGEDVSIPDAFAEGVGIRGTTEFAWTFHAGDRITVMGEPYRVLRVTVRPWTKADRKDWPKLKRGDKVTVVDLESA